MDPQHEEGFFAAKDGVRLFWSSDVPEHPAAHVALVHGYGDHLGRYRETIDALVANGLAVHAFDYRGHGLAGGRRGDCDPWEDYVDDLDRFLARAGDRARGQKLFVFAHSHGALIMVHRLHRDSVGLDGAVFTSPYFRLALEPPVAKVVGARIVGAVVPFLPVPTGIAVEQLTSDPARQAHTVNDPLYGKNTTPRWFAQSTHAQNQAVGFGPQLRLPLLMLCGGDDKVASTAASKAFFDTVAAPDKQFKEYPGMQHEVWNERGRDEVWKDISFWIRSHL